MTTVNIYLLFEDNCEEAFNYYRSVFGGEYGGFLRYKDMPGSEGQELKQTIAEKIMHVSLPIGGNTALMGSDNNPKSGMKVNPGNNFSVSVNTTTKEEADRIFKGLSAGGQVTMPMEDTFWGAYFGMCMDKFGIGWMVSFDKSLAQG